MPNYRGPIPPPVTTFKKKEPIATYKPTREEEKREAVAIAAAKVKWVASEIEREDASEERVFRLMWKLAHVDLRDLEEFRSI